MIRRSLPVIVLSAALLRAVAAMLIPTIRLPGWLDVALAVLAAVAAITLLILGPREPRRVTAAAVVAAFWLTSTVSALAAGQSIPVAAVAMGAVAAALILGPPESVWPLRVAFAVGAGVVVASLAHGLLTGAGVLDGAFHNLTEEYVRATFGIPNLRGIALHPNILGPIAALTLITAFTTVLSSRWWPLWVVAGMSGICLLWSQSRGSIASTAFAVSAILLIRRWQGTRPFLILATLVASFVPLIVFLLRPESSFMRDVFTGRTLAWKPAFDIFTFNPWLGLGPDVFSRGFWIPWPTAEWQPLHAHGEWPEVAAESGLLGLTALAAVVLIAVVTMMSRRGPNAWLPIGVFAIVGTQAIVEVPLGVTYYPISYLLPCLVVTAFAYRGDPGRIAPGREHPEHVRRPYVSGAVASGSPSTTRTSG